MFSNSNSFLGGANSGRPGGAPYGQQPQYGASFGPQQQTGFPAQHTQFEGGQLQSQATGVVGYGQQPGSQLSSQPQQFQNPIGYGQQPYQSQIPQIPQPQLQTGQQLAQQPSQRTGHTSSEIAQSFQGTSSVKSQAPAPSRASGKIPTIRLSFITAQDQAKFEQLFKSAVGDGQALSGRSVRIHLFINADRPTGDKARDLLLRSKLSGDVLSQIWYF